MELYHTFGKVASKREKQQKLKMVAMQLKLEPEWKLSQIATAYGFYDEFHMSKAFKQKFGVSPSDYRNMLSNKESSANQ